jgi:hypothetical protein
MRIKSKQLEKIIFVFIILGLDLVFIFSIKFKFIALLTIIISLLAKITVVLFIIGGILVVLGSLGFHFVTPFSWKSFKSLFGTLNVDKGGEQLFSYPVEGVIYINTLTKIGFNIIATSIIVFSIFVLAFHNIVLGASVDNITPEEKLLSWFLINLFILIISPFILEAFDKKETIVKFYQKGVYISAYDNIIIWDYWEKAEIKENNLILYLKGISDLGKDKIVLRFNSELLPIIEEHLKIIKN